MRISIIIPSYNTAKYIRQAIDSVLDQGYPEIEIMVVDGMSTDGTLEILKSYGDKISWVYEKDKGEADAVNKGMELCTGEVIAYLDADDVYMPNVFDIVAAMFALNTSLMWLYGKGKIIDEQGNECRSFLTRFKEIFQKRYSYNALLCVDFICQPTAFWRRSLVDEIGGFPINEKLAFEYDFWLRAGKKYKPQFINWYIAGWRAHPQSETARDIYKDMHDALRISGKYTTSKVIRLIQYVAYLGAVSMYFVVGVLKR